MDIILKVITILGSLIRIEFWYLKTQPDGIYRCFLHSDVESVQN
jgi:hypothetical protein